MPKLPLLFPSRNSQTVAIFQFVCGELLALSLLWDMDTMHFTPPKFYQKSGCRPFASVLKANIKLKFASNTMQ